MIDKFKKVLNTNVLFQDPDEEERKKSRKGKVKHKHLAVRKHSGDMTKKK